MKESSDTALTDEALKCIAENHPDFVFLYMVETDEKGGHDNGWMSEEYLRRVSIAIDNVKRVIENYGDEYSVIIMADHGGHDRTHGTTLPEDMTVPMFIFDKNAAKGEMEGEISLLEIAPTIASIMGITPDEQWEGRALV
jgi:phosphopentomutase